MLSDQIDQAERKAFLRNDARVREQQREREQQGTTFHQFAQADVTIPRNRFDQVNAATVIGSKARIAAAYPAASAAHQTELPPEEPLGYCVSALTPHELEPSLVSSPPVEAQATDGPFAPSIALPSPVSEAGGPSSFTQLKRRKL
jgi:hypothetical protein